MNGKPDLIIGWVGPIPWAPIFEKRGDFCNHDPDHIKIQSHFRDRMPC
jgi:hypothetical protein